MSTPKWLEEHRDARRRFGPLWLARQEEQGSKLLADKAFNNHARNDGTHVSPFDEGMAHVGTHGLQVRLIQGINEEQFRYTLRRTIRATNGIGPDDNLEDTDPEEMLRGGLQTALESQVLVFEVIGASRVLTHQLVRSRRAAFHQQSQRATWYGDRPNARVPLSVLQHSHVQDAWDRALLAAWEAYKMACDAGVSYQDARYILPEGTANYIITEYPLREFLNFYAYRGCSMFQWEMVQCAREMRRVLIEAHPFLEPYVKISCEKGSDCENCDGKGTIVISGIEEDCSVCRGIGSNRRCTFQGWENVEQGCDFPWARQDNRVFLPDPRNRIG